jgi:putative transcriptional regulator
MSTAFESITQGLGEAISHAKAKGANKPAGIKLYHPQSVDVPALRGRLGFTQEQFAARFGFSVATLRCQRRLNIDPPCRSNIDPGRVVEF